MHGTTMIFLVIVPILAGLRQLPRAADDRRARHGVPAAERALVLAVPARRRSCSTLSFFAKGGAARGGWTTYAPLSTLHTPGNGQDLWILGLHILSISSLVGAINFIVTIHNMRAPGHDAGCASRSSAGRSSPTRWLLVIVLPTLSAGLTMMLLDRQAGTHFFDPAARRQPDPLPARLLVLRAPRGLHHDPARDGDHLGDPPRLRAQADLRLQGGRDLDRRASRSTRCSSGRTTCSRSACRSGSTSSSCSAR